MIPDVKTVTTTTKDGNVTTITTTTTSEHETVEKELRAVEQHKEKLQKGLNGGNLETPSDDGISKTKTPEQEANLAKLTDAKKFLQTEEGAKLNQSLIEQQGEISKGQKKLLKKQGIDPDAFIQEWNKKNPNSANNKRHDAQSASENRDEMGALANAHLGEDTEQFPQGRASKKSSEVRNPDQRTFFQKLFTKKEKQTVADDKKYTETGGTKVNLHSSQTAERKSPFLNDVSDDMAKEGQEYLNAFKNAGNSKRRVKLKEIDENGNVVKTKILYNKDGSVRKVITKGGTNGKLIVRAAKDGHVTIKGHLQSENTMVEAGQKEIERITRHVDTKVEKTVIEECDDKKVEPTPTPPVKPKTIKKPRQAPTPAPTPTPPPVKPKDTLMQGGLVADFVNDQNPNGMGSVQGSTIRKEMKAFGPQAMAVTYCGYERDSDCPEQAKKMWSKNTAYQTNKYNGEHIAQSLISDTENGKVNETDLAAFITELRRTNNSAALTGVKQAISNHNKNVLKLAPEKRGFDKGTRTVNLPVTGKEMAITWLLGQKNL